MSMRAAPEDTRQALGFGVLGYGFMAKAHSNALRTIPYMFWEAQARPRLISICGRTETGVRNAASRYGYPSYTTDWHDLVVDPQVDIFDNVASDVAHVEPIMAAIAAGKHVVCEKPLASNAADAMRMWQAADAADIKNLVCFNYRFFPAVRLAWELIQNGDLGEMYQGRFRYSQEWRNDPDADLPSPTGAMGIIGCHAVDQARFLCGEISTVSAIVSSPVTNEKRVYRGQTVEQDDVVVATAQFDSGLVATIDASLIATGRRNHLSWELNGSRGSVSWDLEQPNVLRRYDARVGGFADIIACEPGHPLVAPWWPSGHVLGWEHGHINMLAHFLEAIASDQPVGPFGATFFDGLRAAQVTEAIAEAAGTGTQVAVAPA